MARRLADWREDEARRQNRPLRQVVRDDLLVAIAKRQPAESPRPRSPARLQPPGLLNRSQEILAILDRGPRRPGGPASRARPHGTRNRPASRPSPTCSPRRSRSAARRHQIAGSLVANVADLKHLVRWHLDGRPTIAPPRPPPRLAGRALRPALARRARRPTRPPRRRPRERVPGRARAGRSRRVAGRIASPAMDV